MSEPVRRHSVVAGALVEGQRVLLCHRTAARRWYPDVWDLPGGHVEDGEQETAALVRELREELGVRIEPPAHPPLVRLPLAAAEPGELAVWVVRRWSGHPRNLARDEHDELRWVGLDDLDALRLPDPCYPDLLRRAVGEGSPPPA